MSRRSRTTSVGLHHVINRGVEKRLIFLDDFDRRRFLRLVEDQKAVFDFDTIAYCLMPNHYHFLIETRFKNLSDAFKNLDQNYAQYFNKKYDRVGALWQSRFKSWFVYDERYLSVLIKYIERNPIKAGLASRIGEYPWASAATEDPTLSREDIAQLTEFFSVKFMSPTKTASVDGASDDPIPVMQKPLSQHFLRANLARKRKGEKRVACDEAINNALRDGYTQMQIAHYLGLTRAAISKRLKLTNGV